MLLSNEISKLPNSVYSLRKKTHQDSLIFSNALKSENSKVFVKKRKTLQTERSSTKQLTIKVMKCKGKLRKCCRLKETTETGQLKAARESEAGLFAIITLLAQLKKLNGISA